MKGFALVLISMAAGAFCRASPTFVLNPPTQTVALGSQVILTLAVNGLGGGVSPALGTYDLNVIFDPALLSYNSTVFGTQLDPDAFGNIQTATPGTGTLEVFELSLDPAADLVVLEPSAFDLATLTFDTLQAGADSPVTLSAIAIGDENGNPLAVSLTNASVTIGAGASAPEPGTIMLLCLGLVVFHRAKRSRTQTGT